MFIDSLNCKKYEFLQQPRLFDLMTNKKVLIVSSFANLIKQQHESGNLNKLYSNYPPVANMVYYTSPYTFFNKGPDKNILETCENVFNDIEKIKDDFDLVVISFGAYSNLLAYYIESRLNKDTITLGEQIQTYFGIINGRKKYFMKQNNEELKNKEYYITEIPEEYKPENYMKIEKGCYW